MQTFIDTFSFTFGVVFALACFPALLVIMTVGVPNAIMGVITRLASNGWKARKWARAVERDDRSQMDFLRKWGWDKIA